MSLQQTSVELAAEGVEAQDPNPNLASFTFLLESRKGYVAEGYYPNVTLQQYAAVLQALAQGREKQPIIYTGE